MQLPYSYSADSVPEAPQRLHTRTCNTYPNPTNRAPEIITVSVSRSFSRRECYFGFEIPSIASMAPFQLTTQVRGWPFVLYCNIGALPGAGPTPRLEL